jgi:hypothetical protein
VCRNRDAALVVDAFEKIETILVAVRGEDVVIVNAKMANATFENAILVWIVEA